MGDVTSISDKRDEVEEEKMFEYKYICTGCHSPVFMLYSGVVKCALCDALLDWSNFNPSGQEEPEEIS